jgi:hypothetical protein
MSNLPESPDYHTTHTLKERKAEKKNQNKVHPHKKTKQTAPQKHKIKSTKVRATSTDAQFVRIPHSCQITSGAGPTIDTVSGRATTIIARSRDSTEAGGNGVYYSVF